MSDSKRMVIIPAGALFTVSAGAYSDYTVHGVFRALAPIDAEALRTAWLVEHPNEKSDYEFREWAFLSWVTRQGLIDPVTSYEWHLSDYSRSSEMSVGGPDIPDISE